jgi:hypothetical protein
VLDNEVSASNRFGVFRGAIFVLSAFFCGQHSAPELNDFETRTAIQNVLAVSPRNRRPTLPVNSSPPSAIAASAARTFCPLPPDLISKGETCCLWASLFYLRSGMRD